MEAVAILGSEKTNPQTLKTNLTTFKNVYFLLSDEGVLAVFEKVDGEATTTEDKLTEALTKKDKYNNTVLNKVIDELDKNENTRSLIPLVGKIAISALYDTLGIPENAEEAYEKVKEGIQGVLTTDTEAEGAKEAITDSLTETLNGIGITVSDSGEEGTISSKAVETMAEQVMEKQDEIKKKLESENIDVENITDADVLNVLLSYYTDYLEGKN
jgi:predicted transcriptional regulator